MPIILTVGSLHYDIMVEAGHLPRKDETAVGSRWYPKFGGKGGNQAVAAAKAGAQSRMFGAVGRDEFGKFLREKLVDAQVSDQFVASIADVGSGMSVAIQDPQGDYAATIVSGANLNISVSALADSAVWDGVKVLILQNEVPEAVNFAAAMQARKRQIPVLCNAAPYRALSPEFREVVDILVVNSIEAEMMGAGNVCCLNSAADAAKKLAEHFETVIVTAGSQGLVVYSANDMALCLAAEKVKVVSSHGAGDCFVGTLAAALASGQSLEQGCRTASESAARHVAGL